jgi:hypothetical protein
MANAFTSQEKLEAVEQEINYRRRVYERRVAHGKMSPQLAAKQIAIFVEIRDDYKALVEKERLT